MKLEEFKAKYFTNNFYWINKHNCEGIQMIGLEVGCLLHTGEKDFITWEEGITNLGYRTKGGQTYCQRECFLAGGKKATDTGKMIADYKELKDGQK